MSQLELRDVVKHYRSGGEVVRAVDGISLTLAPGELATLYGPSGSGKTTLLLLCAAVLAPDGGSVHFGGRCVSTLTQREAARYRLRELGLVGQSFHLFAGASALENASRKLLAAGVDPAEAENRARPWLARVGLLERASHRPSELSMGERQRVAIARALAAEPRLLLADEPTGNLDSRRTRDVLALLRDLAHERAMPILLATHDPQAADFADRVLTLRDGQLSEGLGEELVPPPVA